MGKEKKVSLCDLYSIVSAKGPWGEGADGLALMDQSNLHEKDIFLRTSRMGFPSRDLGETWIMLKYG